MADEPTSNPDPSSPLTPDQLAAIKARAQAALAVVKELVTVTQMVEAHDFAGLLGELRAAFGVLVPSRP